MVIQRWQSVLLFLVFILILTFALTPFATYTGQGNASAGLFVYDYPVILTVTVLIAVLVFISIFLYKNLKRQMTVTLVTAFLIIADTISAIIVAYNSDVCASPAYLGGIGLMFFAFILELMAWKLMKNDLNKLRSYDRLR